MQLTQKK